MADRENIGIIWDPCSHSQHCLDPRLPMLQHIRVSSKALKKNIKNWVSKAQSQMRRFAARVTLWTERYTNYSSESHKIRDKERTIQTGDG